MKRPAVATPSRAPARQVKVHAIRDTGSSTPERLRAAGRPAARAPISAVWSVTWVKRWAAARTSAALRRLWVESVPRTGDGHPGRSCRAPWWQRRTSAAIFWTALLAAGWRRGGHPWYPGLTLDAEQTQHVLRGHSASATLPGRAGLVARVSARIWRRQGLGPRST